MRGVTRSLLLVLPLALGACGSLSYQTWGADLEGAGRVVVLFHGFGAPASDLKSLAIDVKAGGAPVDTCYVLAEGPLTQGMGAAWFRDREGALSLRPKVLALLEKVRAKAGLDWGRVYVGGFSQGATVAVDAALFAPEPLGGVLAVAPAPDPTGEWAAASQGPTPILVVHGGRDSVVNPGASQGLVERLAGQGHSARLLSHAGGHTIPADVPAEFAALLAEGP